MKVLLVNNYDLPGILKSLQEEKGNAPAQHLWGYTALSRRGVDVDILPFKQYEFLKKLSGKLKILGDLDQQWRLLFKAQQYDVIYSAHHLTTLSLSFLRLIKLLNKPIVAIAYQGSAKKTWFWKLFTKIFVEGNDKILCLSEPLLKDLEELGVPAQKLEMIAWGTDLRFYHPDTSAEDQQKQLGDQRFIFSPGKTYRDYETLLDAFETLDCQLTVCAGGGGNFDAVESLPSNTTVIREMIPWRDLIKLYQQAYAVVIPLTNADDKLKNAIGLTALTEAIAVGKAVVMTRNEYVGIDLEKEGIGLWVETGDVEGWQKAISYLLEHPEVTQEMGRKARLLAERRFNLECFSSELAEHLQQVSDCVAEPVEATS